jgi:hypothetical protein
MFQFLFKYFSNSDTTNSVTNSATNTTTSPAISREYPFNIHYRTAYKKCWIDKIKNKGYPL